MFLMLMFKHVVYVLCTGLIVVGVCVWCSESNQLYNQPVSFSLLQTSVCV